MHEGTHLDSMLKTEELPAGISKLDAGLTNVDRKAFPHSESKLITLLSDKRNVLRFRRRKQEIPHSKVSAEWNGLTHLSERGDPGVIYVGIQRLRGLLAVVTTPGIPAESGDPLSTSGFKGVPDCCNPAIPTTMFWMKQSCSRVN